MKLDKQHPATMEGLVKVTFDLPKKDGRIASESLWAEPVGGNSYRLRNVPFFVYGYSEQDIIRAEASESRLTVRGIVERGGHSTYRIFLAEKTTEEQFNKDWLPLGELGCSYERASQRLIAVDVPPHANVYAVYDVLQNAERDRLWEFEEGHCGHPLRQTFR
jgi:Domain of unknown function (DUF4265)